jgi:outer membrane protein OmpA-like peptidoglycan-associated protein
LKNIGIAWLLTLFMVAGLGIRATNAQPAPHPLPPPICEPFMVFYDIGSAELDEIAFQIMARVVAAARHREQSDILISDYTDGSDNEEADSDLSLQRAKSVQAVLVAQGSQESRITTVARGLSTPAMSRDLAARIYSERSEEEITALVEIQNRRTVVEIECLNRG